MLRSIHRSGFILVFNMVALIVAGICGCIPGPYIYYRANAQGGELTNRFQAALAPKDMIEFSLSSVKVQVIGSGRGISLVVLVPEGKSASFVSDEFEVYDNLADIVRIPFRISYYDWQTKEVIAINPTDIMVGRNQTTALFSEPKPRIFETFAEIGRTERMHYYVKIPNIRTDNKIIEVPLIEFTKQEAFGVIPAN